MLISNPMIPAWQGPKVNIAISFSITGWSHSGIEWYEDGIITRVAIDMIATARMQSVSTLGELS